MTRTNEERRNAFLDPVSYQRVALGRKLWGKQKDLLRAVDRHNSVSVKGCHASGKTFAVAGLVPWWLQKHKQAVVINIAPTMRQVKLMWREIKSALAGSRIAYPEAATTSLEIADDRYAIGVSSSAGINVQGFHSPNILLIIDEAPGVEADIYESIEGIKAGGNVKTVKLGNPTVPSGEFYDDFTRANSGCVGISISAFDTPNLKGTTIEQLLEMSEEQLDYSPEPNLIRRRWVKDRYLRWGAGNPRYISRVLGEFPGASEFAVFSLADIQYAQREPTAAELRRAEGCVIQVGIDVAGPGDDETAACARVNGIIIAREQWSHTDANVPVANWLHNLRKTQPYQLGLVVVDVFGIGAELGIFLAQNGGFDVFGFQGGKVAMDAEKFLNAKSEAYWRLRDMYRAKYISHLPGALDEEKEAQLCGILWREVGRGLIQIEPKEEARKRGVSSPDRAEAEIMAFCRVVPRQQQVEFSEPVIISQI